MTKQAQALPATLRAIRAKLDLTQEQLAERLGVSFATVNRWEGGGSKPQRAAQEAILALARETGVEEAAEDAPEAAVQVSRRRSRRTTAATPTTKPMEQMLWDAACSIRGDRKSTRLNSSHVKISYAVFCLK